MASAEIPNPAPDVTNPAAADAEAAVSVPAAAPVSIPLDAPAPSPTDAPASADVSAPAVSSSPPLPPRKRRLSPSPSPTLSTSRSHSPRCCSRSRSRSRSRSPQYPHDGKRRRHNDLTIEVCRDYLRERCTRSDIECRYAHPHHSVSVDRENKVTACADSLRNNCFRGRTCRYYHPPPHIQESLLKSIGVEDPKLKMVCRDFARGKCSRSANECRFLHHSSVEDCAIVCQDFLRGRCERKSCRYSHAAAHPMPPMGNIPIHYPDMLYMPPPPPLSLGVPMMGPLPSPPRAFADFRNSVEVCRDFLKNACNRESCRFLHPDTHAHPSVMSDKVEICRDFQRGECNRPACRFYHPYAS